MNKPDNFSLRFTLAGSEEVEARNYIDLIIGSDVLIEHRNDTSIELKTKEYEVTIKKNKGKFNRK